MAPDHLTPDGDKIADIADLKFFNPPQPRGYAAQGKN